MENTQLKRAGVSYKPTYQIFLQKEKNYIQQYSHVYLKRLLALRHGLQGFIEQSKGCSVAEKIIGLKVGERVGVVGTLYKDQKLKPNVLDEFSNDVGAVPQAKRENYAADDDSLLLEDESGRCNLQGVDESEWKQTVGELVSGIVVGCIGKLLETGTFEVEQMIFPGETYPKELPAFKFQDSKQSTTHETRYMVLTSGLYAGSSMESNSLYLQMLVDYVGGIFNPTTAASIVRVIVAGGAISPPRVDDAFKNTTIDAKLQVETQEILVESLRVADRWYAELASLCPVDVMPGEHDPSNASLPQQPLHQCLFSQAYGYKEQTFKLVPNPHSFQLGDNLNVLGHSGQPLQDALRYMSPSVDALDVLQRSLLQYRHLAPTAPDTLACYPFHDRDPFVIEKDNYRVLFAGGCSKFSTSFVQGTRFICVPDFRTTKQIVLVNLDSPELEAATMSFEINL